MMPCCNLKIMVFIALGLVLGACGSEKKKSRPSNNPILINLKDYENDRVQLSQEEGCREFLQVESKEQVFPLYSDFFVSEKFQGKAGDLIHYYGYVFDNKKSPIIFYNGGPSSDSHGMLTVFSQETDRFRELIYQEQSFIFMDQRGTGCSDKYPNVRFVADADAPEFLQRLQDDWASSAIVADSEILRKKFFGGDVKWKIYGQSYGALIAHRYLELAPEGIDSVHAHGFAITDPKDFNRFRYHSQKTVFEQFLKEHPNAKPAVEKLYTWLDTGICFYNGDAKEQVCGRQALDSLILAMANKLIWQDIADIFVSFIQDDKVKQENVGKLVKRLKFMEGDDVSTNVAATVISLSEIDYGRNPNDPTGCEEAIAYWEQKGEPNSQWYVSECRPGKMTEEDKGSFKIFLELPPKPVSLAKVKANIDQYQIPFFLYSSGHDPLVPHTMFSKEIELLESSVNYVHFPNSGHEGFLTESKIWENLEMTAAP